MSDSFTFDGVASIIVDDGAAGRLGEIMRDRFGLSKAMVVTDKGITSLGLADAAIASLAQTGFDPIVFDDVEADPAESIVLSAAQLATEQGVGLVVGFGGGSSMDVAKLVAILAKGEQELPDMYGVGNVRSSRLPLVLIPTTAGTGSEVTPISVVTTGATTKNGGF